VPSARVADISARAHPGPFHPIYRSSAEPSDMGWTAPAPDRCPTAAWYIGPWHDRIFAGAPIDGQIEPGKAMRSAATPRKPVTFRRHGALTTPVFGTSMRA
jgi:hypothetical protein